MKQLRSLTHDAPEGISVYLRDDNLTSIDADIDGPEDTPYENGVFRCKLVLARDYPASPPKAYFTTKIFHPNVSKTGEICVNSLKKDWKPLLGIRHLLSVVRCLLIIPNPESALNEEAGKLLLENYADYARRARLFTSIHARSKSVRHQKQSALPLQPHHQDEALASAHVSRPVDEAKVPGTSAHSMMTKASKKKAVKKKSLKRL